MRRLRKLFRSLSRRDRKSAQRRIARRHRRHRPLAVERLEERQLLAIDFDFAVAAGGAAPSGINTWEAGIDVEVGATGDLYWTGHFKRTATFGQDAQGEDVSLINLKTVMMDQYASIVDGDSITLIDGVNPPVTFEYDVSGDGVAAGNIEIDTAGLTGAEDFANATRSGDQRCGRPQRQRTADARPRAVAWAAQTTGGVVIFDAEDVAPSSANGVLQGAENKLTGYLVRTAADGTVKWATRVGPEKLPFEPNLSDMALDASGAAYLVGTNFGHESTQQDNPTVTKINADGHARLGDGASADDRAQQRQGDRRGRRGRRLRHRPPSLDGYDHLCQQALRRRRNCAVVEGVARGRRAWEAGRHKSTNDSTGIVVDGSHVYVGGWFRGAIDFDPSAADFILESTMSRGSVKTPTQDAFLWKLDTDGNFVAAAAMGGRTHNDAITDLVLFGGRPLCQRTERRRRQRFSIPAPAR